MDALFVSPDGRDEWPGTEERPLATPERARDTLRRWKAEGAMPPHGVTVWFRGGEYRRARTFLVSEEDSGAAGAPIVYRVRPGETVRFSGGVRITGWQRLAADDLAGRLDGSARANVWKADLTTLGLARPPTPPDHVAFGSEWPNAALVPELFCNDAPMALARWPNEGWATVASIVDSGAKGGQRTPGTFTYAGDRPNRWNADRGVWLQGFWCYDWAAEILRVAHIDRCRQTITLATPAQFGIRTGNPGSRRYRALNVIEELDEPGEYYLDDKENVLYFWPPVASAEMDEARIVLATLDAPLIATQGASHVVFRGMVVEACRHDGIHVNGGTDVRIEACTVRNVARCGIRVQGGTRHRVEACDIHDTGTGGLWIEGGDRRELTAADHEALNNHIWRFARNKPTYSNAVTLSGVGNRAAHNLIHDALHAAVNIKGNDHRFECNRVHDVCLATADCAALYKGRDPSCRGNLIRFNFWQDIGRPMGHGNAAIYFDDGDGGDTVFGNIFLRCGEPGKGNFGAIFSHGGHDILVENNIFIDCRRALGSSPWTDSEWRYTLESEDFQTKLLKDVDITQPPYTTRYPELAGFLSPGPGRKRVNRALRNVFVRCGTVKRGNWELDERQNWITDGDPGFVDGARGDLRLSGEAAVFARLPDFTPIPFEQIGLYTDPLRTHVPVAGRETDDVKRLLRVQDPAPICFYVSPGGDDTWSGTLAAPNADRTNGPFATVQRARDAVRVLQQTMAERSAGNTPDADISRNLHGTTASAPDVRSGLTSPVRVLLREGVYELDEPLTFGPADSGSAACPITYAAYPGECPVLSGGSRIGGWRAGEMNGRPCLVTDLPDAAAGKWPFTQLFVNGTRRPRGRLPATGYFRFAADDQADPATASFTRGELKRWENLQDVELVLFYKWRDQHLRIENVDEERRVVRFAVPPRNPFTDETRSPCRYYVDNVAEAVREAGQWYLDRPSGRLYYMPLPGETPDTIDVYAPRLERIVTFSGGSSAPVRHVRLEWLSLKHAECRCSADNPGASQAASDVPGAVCFDKSEHCALYGCDVSQVGGYGVEMGGFADRLIGCEIHDLGAGGVKISGNHNVVSDCAITDGGKHHHQAVGVLVFDCHGTRIRHNEIAHFDYTGISCGWTWGYTPPTAGDNRIEGNHVHDIGRGRLSDLGGIYTLGVQPGTVIRGNVIHDVSRYHHSGRGIYLDEGSGEILVEDNTVYRTDDAGFHQHYGRDNLVRNNVFALGRSCQISCTRREPHRSFVLTGNILYWTQGSCVYAPYGPRMLIARNLFWRMNPPLEQEDGEVRAADPAGWIADPCFAGRPADARVEPTDGGFWLGPSSPAMRDMGFKWLPTSGHGPRFRRTADELPPTLEGWPDSGDVPSPCVRTRLELATRPAADGAGGRVRVTLHNVGAVACSGNIRVRCGTAPCADAISGATVRFALQPDESATEELAFTVDPDALESALETDCDAPGVLPACLYVSCPRPLPAPWPVARTSSVRVDGNADLDAIQARLADVQPAIAPTADGLPLIEVRVGVAGSDLLLHAKVPDRSVQPEAMERENRKLDVTCRVADSPDAVGLRFEMAAGRGLGGRTALVIGGTLRQRDPAGVSFVKRPLADPGGYELMAAIPLALLRVDPAARSFMVNVSVWPAVERGAQPTAALLFPEGFRGVCVWNQAGGANSL